MKHPPATAPSWVLLACAPARTPTDRRLQDAAHAYRRVAALAEAEQRARAAEIRRVLPEAVRANA